MPTTSPAMASGASRGAEDANRSVAGASRQVNAPQSRSSPPGNKNHAISS